MYRQARFGLNQYELNKLAIIHSLKSMWFYIVDPSETFYEFFRDGSAMIKGGIDFGKKSQIIKCVE